MKTINKLRKYIVSIIITIICFSFATIARGQNNLNNRNEENYERREYRKNDRKEDNSDSRSGYSYSEKNNRKNRKNYESNEYYRPKYSKNYLKHDYYFHHNEYGKVYHRFNHSPVVFKHKHGDYYFYDNNFYRYRKGVGYCITEMPNHLIFRNLPIHCRRININGHVLYSNGNLFFRYTPHGFILVSAPRDINLTFRF